MELGAGPLLLDALRRFEGNPHIQTPGLGALGNLANFPSHDHRLLGMGAAKVLLQGMARHADVVSVQREGCRSLGTLG